MVGCVAVAVSVFGGWVAVVVLVADGLLFDVDFGRDILFFGDEFIVVGCFDGVDGGASVGGVEAWVAFKVAEVGFGEGVGGVFGGVDRLVCGEDVASVGGAVERFDSFVLFGYFCVFVVVFGYAVGGVDGVGGVVDRDCAAGLDGDWVGADLVGV